MARVLQAVSDRSEAAAPDRSSRTTTATSSGKGVVRKLLLVVALGAVVYLVTRLGRGSSATSLSGDGGTTTHRETATADQSPAELPGEDRSPAEIEERGTENVHDEPAEPGEMHVDEEIVDDVVETDSDGSAGDEESEK